MIKKTFLLIALTVATAVKAINFDSATGESDDPYLIKNEADLRELSGRVNEDREKFENKHFRLEVDIELSGNPWIPIGSGGLSIFFSGTFDGNHKKITNFHVKSNDAGLFGATNKATIKNLAIIISAAGVTGDRNAGGLVGRSYGDKITGCYVSGEGAITTTNDKGKCGGLVGNSNKSTITSCYATVEVGSDNDSAGGLVGFVWESEISYSYASGDITGNNISSGGLMGYSHNTTVSYSYAAGKITGSYRDTGGLGAENIGGNINNCYFNSDNKGFKTVGEDYGFTSAEGVSRKEMAAKGLDAMPNLKGGSGKWYSIKNENDIYYFPSPISENDRTDASYKVK